MRPSFSFISAVLLALPLAARAGDLDVDIDTGKDGKECKVTVGRHDRFAQKQNLVIKSGERVESALVMDGDIVIQKGAKVTEDVVAVRGNVVIEEGAEVKGDAVAVGGDVTLKDGAEVDGDAVALGGEVEVKGKARLRGERTSMSLVLGDDLVKKIVGNALPSGQCTVKSKD
ncbi:MAG: hypothetical protein L0Y64_11230 [Myxococcaceae bacterium]|nr:hypothetical protein [Myxococcaceae bacterium]